MKFEQHVNSNSVDKTILLEELNSFSSILLEKLEALNIDSIAKSKIQEETKLKLEQWIQISISTNRIKSQTGNKPIIR